MEEIQCLCVRAYVCWLDSSDRERAGDRPCCMC